MKKLNLDFFVGLFFIAGFLAIAYLSLNTTNFNLSEKNGYTITALFDNVGGLTEKAKVEIAGVPIGTVSKITLQDYRAYLVLNIRKGISIPDDSSATIKTKGLIGEKFVEITPGASDEYINPNQELFDTQSPIDFEKALGKYIFGNVE